LRDCNATACRVLGFYMTSRPRYRLFFVSTFSSFQQIQCGEAHLRNFGFDVERKCFDFVEKFSDGNGGLLATFVEHRGRHDVTTTITKTDGRKTFTECNMIVYPADNILQNATKPEHCDQFCLFQNFHTSIKTLHTSTCKIRKS